MNVAETINAYLRSGGSDPTYAAWPGSVYERGKLGHDELLRALVEEVRRRSAGREHPAVPDLDPTWTRRKLTPMVHGLFPVSEREPVLNMLEKSVVFLTAESIERVLLRQMWLHTAWGLANLYLSSVKVEMLGPTAVALVGLSEETTPYVSAVYFEDRGRVEDFVIHEAAHIFHNCKRATLGLPETRSREWLLPIAFNRRETFAYACEAYGYIVDHAAARSDRLALADKFSKEAVHLTEETIEPAEVAEIVREACEARNGWKVILGRCTAPKVARSQMTPVFGS